MHITFNKEAAHACFQRISETLFDPPISDRLVRATGEYDLGAVAYPRRYTIPNSLENYACSVLSAMHTDEFGSDDWTYGDEP
jgi:hypothetical protein